jgi:hypothetical protein
MKTDKKQTAVDIIISFADSKIRTCVSSHIGAYCEIINYCKAKAKELEKKQMSDFVIRFLNNHEGQRTEDSISVLKQDLENLYNETYGE